MTYKTIKANSFTPLNDKIIVTEMTFGERFTSGGIIMPGDDGKSEGIRPRWGKVFAIGPKQTDVKVGEYVLVSHGRWTRGIKMNIQDEDVELRMIDNNDILLVSDKPVNDDTTTTAVTAVSDAHYREGSLHNCDY